MPPETPAPPTHFELYRQMLGASGLYANPRFPHIGGAAVSLEVGGVRFRETEKQAFLRYPDDADLRPVPIGVAPAA